MHAELGNFQARALPPQARTRASLLQRVRDWSDNTSWNEFYQIYSQQIHSLALKSGLSLEEAEDVVQATMLGVADRIRDFQYDRAAGSFKAWICAQAKSKVIDTLRRRHRQEHLFPPRDCPTTRTGTVGRLPDPQNDHEAFLDRDWNEAVTETALARVRSTVKPKHYQIFDLYVVKQWPLRRISRTLGVSVPHVYVIKSRVSLLLKKQTRRVRAQLARLPAPGVPPQKQNTETV
jgi:RNA polymerase sigma factor (sigma-70 family)